MAIVNVYLTFTGNCEEAFNFYRSVFNREFLSVNRFGEIPPSEEMPPIPDDVKQKIMHISLPISEETVLMGSDAVESMSPPITVGNNFSVSIQTEDADEAKRLFNGLAEGGNVTMPLEKVFWAELFGMVTDRYGINWMVNCGSPE